MKASFRQFLVVTLMAFMFPILAVVVSVHAATISWTDATGFWDVATNWSSNPALPGAGDDVVISVSGVQTITHRTGNDTIRSIGNGKARVRKYTARMKTIDRKSIRTMRSW